MAKQKTRYPFKNMKVGDTFKVEKEKSQLVRNAVNHFVKDCEPDWLFTIRTKGDSLLCERLK